MDIEAMMAQYGSGQMSEEQKRAAISQALAAAGFGILGSNTGGGWQGAARALGRGGLLGMGSYNQSMQDAAAAPMQNLDMIGKMMALKGQQQKMDDGAAAQKSGAEFQQQLAGVFGAGPRLWNMAPGGPTPANAQRVAPASQIEKYRQAAAMYAARGDTEGAKRLADIADKMEGEYSTSPQIGMGPNGAQFAQFSNKGGYRAAEGLAPPPDTQMLNLGGRYQAVDKRTTAPGATFDVTMDPAQKDASARGWADINDRRAKEAAEAKGTTGAAKPTWDSSSGQFVYPPSPDSPQGRAVAPQGYSGKADMNAAKSEKALIAIKEAEDLIDTATGSYFGAGIDQGARAFGAATPGAKASAQLKVAEASIMMNQPRMEGPQSNLDVAMYRQAAGQIGDSTVPPEQKKAALETIKKLHQKYAQMGKPQSVGASGGWSIEPVK